MNINIVGGGKTLCALYARENCVGFMIILGKDERLKFETDRENYSKEVQEKYEEAQTYHDGKFNTSMNFVSKSKKEKYIMTPLSAISAICFWITVL